MFHRIKEKLGTAGFIIAIVALIAATAGGAYAAQQSLSGKQKNEVKKIAKKFAGKNGKNGKNGATGAPGAPGAIGPVGATGATGLPGAQGSQGDPGEKGDPGANGKSVLLTVEPPGVNCPEGGTKVQIEDTPGSTKYVCNGEEGDEGEPGPEGSPWTAGGTLPSGETETGSWAFGTLSAGAQPGAGKILSVALSFPIPLASSLPASNAHYIINGKEAVYNEELELEELDSTACLGTPAAPSAEPGHFCLYAAFQTPDLAQVFGEPGKLLFWGQNNIKNPGSSSAGGTSVAGARIAVANVPTDTHMFGTWAVTAP